MKYVVQTLVTLAVLVFVLVGPVQAQNRYIVQTTGGLTSVLHLCAVLGCQVQETLDGARGQTYLVTSSTNLLSGVLNSALKLLEELLGIVSIEVDRLLPLSLPTLNSIPAGLEDSTPVNYYGTVVGHGYAAQPAAQIIRVSDAQRGFDISGSGSVAVIDTGVDPTHPVLRPILLLGYDFTRNQPGASEWPDVPQLNGTTIGASPASPVRVQQSSAAILEQSSAAILEGEPYVAFGHGTMTSGMVHLVAPEAKILPLKAFSANGNGYLSNIVAALYYAVAHNANIVNMSFDVSAPSPALGQAVNYANQKGLVLVAAAGNEDTSAAVYPAALDGKVTGIASTTDWDTKSSFSNYGDIDVWIAAPGENIISTYPGGTYGSASGTSFSSPLVAGTVALLRSARTPLNQAAAAGAVCHAVPLTENLVHGRLDAYQAVSAWLNGAPPCN